MLVSVNKVWLIGYVAALPRKSQKGAPLVLATVHGGLRRMGVERHLVRISADQVTSLATGALILVEGSLSFEEGRRRHVVVAEQVTALVEPRPPAPRTPPVGVHASPVPHDRAGHYRRINIGKARERLVWVRPTSVGKPMENT